MIIQSVNYLKSQKIFLFQTILLSLSKFIAAISLYLYAKAITKYELGEIAYIQALVVIVISVISIQLPPTIFRFSLNKAYERISFWVVKKSNIFFYFSLIFFIVNFTHSNIFSQILCLSLVQISSLIKLELIRAKSKKNEYFFLAFFQVFFSVGCTALILFFYDKSINAVIIYIIFEYCSWTITLLVTSRLINKIILNNKKFFPKFDKNLFSELVKFGLYLVPTSLSWGIILFAPSIITEFFYGEETLAKFAISNRLPWAIHIFCAIILQILLKNLIIKFESDKEIFLSNYFNYTIFWFVFTSILTVLIYFFNYFLILKIFPSFELSISIQILQFLNVFLLSNFGLMGNFFQVVKKLKFNLITSCLAAILGILFAILFAKEYFIEGILFGITIGLLISIIINMLIIKKIIKNNSKIN